MKFTKNDIEVLDRCIYRFVTLKSYFICDAIFSEQKTRTQRQRLKKLLYRMFRARYERVFWPHCWYLSDRNRIKALHTMKRAIKLILAGKIKYSDLPKSKRLYKTDPTNFRIPTTPKQKKIK